MHNVISAQLYKCLRTKSFYVLVAISFISTLFDLITVSVNLRVRPEMIVEGFDSMYEALSGGLYFLFIGIFASLVFTSDYSSQSIRQIIGKGTKRTSYTFGSIFTVFVLSLVIAAVAYVAAFLRGTFVGSGTGPFDGLMILRFVCAVLVFGFMYVSFTQLVANITRKTSWTLIIAIFAAPILQLCSFTLTALTEKKMFFDPITLMDLATSTSTAPADYLFAVIPYFCAGILLTCASIIVSDRKDL